MDTLFSDVDDIDLEDKPKLLVIFLCPKCKQYLGMKYRYCLYCGILLENQELIKGVI